MRVLEVDFTVLVRPSATPVRRPIAKCFGSTRTTDIGSCIPLQIRDFAEYGRYAVTYHQEWTVIQRDIVSTGEVIHLACSRCDSNHRFSSQSHRFRLLQEPLGTFAGVTPELGTDPAFGIGMTCHGFRAMHELRDEVGPI